MNEPPTPPRIFVDFNNSDPQGRVRLNCVGTVNDLAEQKIILREGMLLLLSCSELESEGVASYSSSEGLWVASIDWDKIRDRTGSPVE